MRRTIRKLMAEAKAKAEAAKAKAEAAKAKAEAVSPWALFRARRRRWARTVGVEQRESPWALQVGAVRGQVRPSGAAAAPL